MVVVVVECSHGTGAPDNTQGCWQGGDSDTHGHKGTLATAIHRGTLATAPHERKAATATVYVLALPGGKGDNYLRTQGGIQPTMGRFLDCANLRLMSRPSSPASQARKVGVLPSPSPYCTMQGWQGPQTRTHRSAVPPVIRLLVGHVYPKGTHPQNSTEVAASAYTK